MDFIRKKIFYNALIRNTLLCALKFYSTAFNCIYSPSNDESTAENVAIGIVLLIVLTIIPVFYAWTLYRRRDELRFPFCIE